MGRRASGRNGGSEKTAEFAKKHKKPCLHVHSQLDAPAAGPARFITAHNIKVIKVAGSRASKEPEVRGFMKQVLEEGLVGEVD